METTIILVAGGSGKRMAASQPKQFLPIHGKSILQHTIEAFHRFDPTFKYIVVLPKEY
ncbi:MAG: 2-C-methyl-D-erythritol 4-phosphate cytidylyltransferase, partial [Flavobacteriales bacterium]|nr:2-C-methyl-D-erythritol 4-phosphate cytidylyltransferase [Flavobacteriales bacterium]